MLQSDWPIFQLLFLLSRKMYLETFGPLQECVALGIEPNETLLHYPNALRGVAAICSSFSSAVNLLQRALRLVDSSFSSVLQMIEQAEYRLKAIALDMQVWDFFAVAGQLRVEDNPFRLLAQLQEHPKCLKSARGAKQPLRLGPMDFQIITLRSFRLLALGIIISYVGVVHSGFKDFR